MSKGFIKAGVIGHPIAHSKSPLIHNYWIEKYGLQGAYDTIDIAPENLAERVNDLVKDGYAGFNVTVPHKEAIFKLCDHVDDTAKSVGAVNTVTIRDGKLYGTNSDVFGFVQNIIQHSPDFAFNESKAVIIGAGGAARAVLHGLIEEKCAKIAIVNRTKEKAEYLASSFDGAHVYAWEDIEHALEGAGFLVNTTSLGMVGQPTLDIDLDALLDTALVNDIVYTPLMTDLLNNAQDRNNAIVTGIGMLLHQARPAFEAWFGVMPDVDDNLERLVLS